MQVKRGDIILADLSGAKFSEQGSHRPALVIQNNTGNDRSSTTIVVPLTSVIKKENQPTHVVLKRTEVDGLDYDSMVLCEQVRTIDKKRLLNKIGEISSIEIMKRVFAAYMANFGAM